MNKKIVAIVSFFVLTMFTGTVRAEWSQAGFVTTIQFNRDSYENGDVFVWLNGTGCSATNDYFRIRQSGTTKEDLEEMMRLLIASKLSERPVRLGFSRDKGTCSVYSVKF
ncbi:hypothetical protein ANRL2_03105 [Anaerolineae bacterium]|uniref:hypothetical protein n=1 Tax=Geobacter sp. TaxID=46610 RepID=UPI001AD1D986|nr:hypothetical protein [Geobacter sp.]CAG0989975.1 hypothetical protein ANRL2_03105 [Anaerolineae bacterium]